MNFFKKLYCRTYQTIFRIAIPILPYREPKILNNNGELVDVLKEQNVKKANYICNDVYDWPVNKDEIGQRMIFDAQKFKYQHDIDCRIAVLNSLPIFLFEYFK